MHREYVQSLLAQCPRYTALVPGSEVVRSYRLLFTQMSSDIVCDAREVYGERITKEMAQLLHTMYGAEREYIFGMLFDANGACVLIFNILLASVRVGDKIIPDVYRGSDLIFDFSSFQNAMRIREAAARSPLPLSRGGRYIPLARLLKKRE